MSDFLKFKRYKTKPVEVEQIEAAEVPRMSGLSINIGGRTLEPGQIVVRKPGSSSMRVISKEEFEAKYVPFRQKKAKK